MTESLELRVDDIVVEVLTGIYSEETHRPQPIRVSIVVEMPAMQRYSPDTKLSASKNYLDLREAVTERLPRDVHFNLIEAVADHIIADLFAADWRLTRVVVTIAKLAIAGPGETIGIRLARSRHG